MEETDTYSIDYTLVRTVDFSGTVQISDKCKRTRAYGLEGTDLTYKIRVDEADFRDCQYNIIDAGKFHENPGKFIRDHRFSRMGANRGELYYS